MKIAKDLTLVRQLHRLGRIAKEIVRERLEALDVPLESKPRLVANFQSAMA